MRTTITSAAGVVVAWTVATIATTAWPLTPAVLRIAAADALVIEALMLVVAAPVAGVAIARRRDGAAWRHIAGAAGVFTTVSALAAFAAAAMSGLPMVFAFRSHMALAAVALALTALGAWLSTLCRDLLDACALAVAISVALSAAVLVAGPATARLPQALVDASLLASPPIAVSAAAGIDLLRSEVLYQLSPISHRRFTYPAWSTSAVVYAAAAVVLLAIGRRPSST